MSYKIVQKQNRHAVYAAGFYTLDRAESWLAKYDVRMWVDKTIQREDLEIVNEQGEGDAMSKQACNSQGVRQGPNGYVVCGVCHKDAQDVSRETGPAYAFHVKCKPGVFGYQDPRVRFEEFLASKVRA